AGEQRPGPPAATAVIRTAIVVLAVTVVIVSVPARSVGGVDLEQGIGEPHAADDQRIVGAAQTEAHELQKIDADLRVGAQTRIQDLIFDRQDAADRAAVADGQRWSYAHVIAGNAELLRERRIAHRGPILEPRIPVVRCPAPARA